MKFNKRRTLQNFNIAVYAVLNNKVRALLTALGIIFGVAAVISMLSIGAGAKREILEQMKHIGVNNIVITPIVEQEEGEIDESEGLSSSQRTKFTTGLTMDDIEAIKTYVNTVQLVCPELILDARIIRKGSYRTGKLIGVQRDYFSVNNLSLSSGNLFHTKHEKQAKPVCIIGSSIAKHFFSGENPLGKTIKCNNQWLEIIGVMNNQQISVDNNINLGIRNVNMDIYIPIQTALVRYQNTNRITKSSFSDDNKQKNNIHQVNRIVVQVKDAQFLESTANIITRMLKRRHQGVVNFEVTIPQLLLQQQQRTKNIFNFVLGAIAGISLLVGGIGIMNIMLASILERIKEIGLRIAIGARKNDIVQQFLFEAVVISVTGGFIGILLGVGFAYLVSSLADIPTIVTFVSIMLSFVVAVSVGLIFGIVPAQKAAQQDPIVSLHHE